MTRSKIRTSGAEGITLDTSASTLTVTNSMTLTDGDIAFASGHGLNFGSTSDVSGMTSELLDDYEEGTWTPSIIGAAGQSGQVYSVQQGGYTKVGNLVLCRFNLQLSTEGSFSGGYLLLSGLPFTLIGTPITVHLNGLYFVTLAANYISLNLQAYEGTNSAYIWAKKSATTSREYLGTSDLTATTQLTGAFCYATNQ
mgnify:CR=1 FL=1